MRSQNGSGRIENVILKKKTKEKDKKPGKAE